MDYRARSVDAGARRKGLSEEGESVAEVAIVGKGQMRSDFDTPGSGGFAERYALAATERNFYVMSLGHVGFKSVKDVAAKMPIGEVELESSFTQVKVSRRGQGSVGQFGTALLASPRKLIKYVESQKT
jgi:hypothetical protein